MSTEKTGISTKFIKSSNFIDDVYQSRKNIIKYLELEGYDCSDFNNFTLNDIHTMINTKQLDILCEKDNKILVKYHLENTLRANVLYEYIEEFYNVDNVLNKNDNFVIVLYDKPNDTLIQLLKSIWEQDGIFISIFSIKNTLFNILDHVMVPKHRKLNQEEKKNIMLKFNITSEEEIPEISRFDPVAIILFLRPGELCEITRYNKTSIKNIFYRICIS
tara:strand:+ start:4988 stop:5641 length:654 start_codon:yes stop_codon:yes gene_type:complete